MTRRTRSHLLTFASALLAASLSHGHARAQTAQGQARVGAFDDYMLKDEEYERDAFRGFAEVL
ncbi:MAG TPA: hypothetical protein VM914_08450, partial [Pyrinomonadaceae bacterium]|nr:hypothetical protein [Pyrinomonadaceae bacterium]